MSEEDTSNEAPHTLEWAARFLTEVRDKIGPRIARATVPLLAEQHDEVKIAGTATMLTVGGATLLVTASHVAKLQAEHGIVLAVP